MLLLSCLTSNCISLAMSSWILWVFSVSVEPSRLQRAMMASISVRYLQHGRSCCFSSVYRAVKGLFLGCFGCIVKSQRRRHQFQHASCILHPFIGFHVSPLADVCWGFLKDLLHSWCQVVHLPLVFTQRHLHGLMGVEGRLDGQGAGVTDRDQKSVLYLLIHLQTYLCTYIYISHALWIPSGYVREFLLTL